MYNKPVLSEAEALQLLKARGAIQVSIPFEGGNDEGFTYDAELYGPNSTSLGTIKEWYCSGYTLDASRNWAPINRPETDDEKLYEFLVAPVTERYGSFAGDFSVQGDCVWTVKDTELVSELHGSETVWQDF